MSDFDPGDRWREIDGNSPSKPGREVLVLSLMGALGAAENRYWVRVDPVPPLPTEPYTVIRTKGRKGFSDWVLTLNEHGHWVKAEAVISAAELPRLITGFEVLAEPRHVTAKAVLDAVREHDNEGLSTFRRSLDRIARDFGVES